MAGWQIDPAHSQAAFSAKHMGIMTVRGHFNELAGQINFNEDDFTASSVQAVIQAASIVTNDAKRDAHLKSADFLDVANHPEITFKSTKIVRAEHDHYNMTGDLTIRGVTRPVTLDVVYSGQGKDPWGGTRAGFSAEATINREDWDLTWNVALETGGFLVSKDVKLTLEVEAVKQVEAAAG